MNKKILVLLISIIYFFANCQQEACQIRSLQMWFLATNGCTMEMAVTIGEKGHSKDFFLFDKNNKEKYKLEDVRIKENERRTFSVPIGNDYDFEKCDTFSNKTIKSYLQNMEVYYLKNNEKCLCNRSHAIYTINSKIIN